MATLYDDRWQAGVAPLRILAFYGLFAAVGSTTGEVFKGAGLPRYVTIYAVLYNVLLGGALLLLGHGFGLEGIACATVVAPLGVSIVALRRVTIVLGIPARTLVGLLATPIQGTIVMVAVVLGMTQLLSSMAPPPAIRLAVLAVSGAVSYGAVLYLRDRAWCREAAATAGVTRGGVGRLERDVA
jgi:O-antigen/teichoic acid export membrane protein